MPRSSACTACSASASCCSACAACTRAASMPIGISRGPSGVMETLAWLRVPGDVVFAAGGVLLAVYALKLLRRPRIGEARPAAGVLQRHIALEEDVLFP